MALTFGNPPIYHISKKIGEGSFGEVYLGLNLLTREDVAIKLESVRLGHRLLNHEASVYSDLKGITSVPSLRWHGTQHGYNALVMDMQGPSLEDLFNLCGRKFTLKTVLLLADQILTTLEQVNSRDYVHRDIKPENILIGRGSNAHNIFMIDFGLSRKFRDARSHKPYRENRILTGTARNSSINTHRGMEQSRRDDLASVGYMLVYFLRGGLPWQGIRAETRQEKNDKILDQKETMTTRSLCQGLPAEFQFLITYANALRFHDRPDYGYLRRVFHDLFVREGFLDDFNFDWSQRTLNTGQTSVSTKRFKAGYPKGYANCVLVPLRMPFINQAHWQHMVNWTRGRRWRNM